MTQQNGSSFSAEKIAKLARLEVESAELASLSSQLVEVLDFVKQVEAVELEDVEPFFGPLNLSNATRPDLVVDSLDKEEALRNAPSRDDDFYLVPPVFG